MRLTELYMINEASTYEILMKINHILHRYGVTVEIDKDGAVVFDPAPPSMNATDFEKFKELWVQLDQAMKMKN